MKMKKIVLLILALSLALALAACGGGDNDGGSAVSNLTDEQLVEKLSGIMDGKTGEMMTETISLSQLAENAGGAPSDFFGTWFNGMALPEGTKVALNQGMMMGQAHIVFLVQPAEGTKADDFAKEMESNANPAWNVCTQADTVKDGLILFVMTSKAELNISADDIIAAFNA